MPSIELIVKGSSDMFGSGFSRIQSVEELSEAWKICTRVKNVLEYGNRYENLSWRLWHHHRVNLMHNQAKTAENFKIDNEKIQVDLINVNETSLAPVVKSNIDEIENVDLTTIDKCLESLQCCSSMLSAPLWINDSCLQGFLSQAEGNHMNVETNLMSFNQFDKLQNIWKMSVSSSIPMTVPDTRMDQLNYSNTSNHSCSHCNTNITSCWRRIQTDVKNPLLIVCNACALYWKLHHKMRPSKYQSGIIRKRRRKNTHP